jgi:hypothetical protein
MACRSASAFALILLILPFPASAQVQTTVAPDQPALPQAQKSPDAVDSIYCRPPQHRTDSQLMGPKVCMTIQKWNDLHAQGLDIGPDGSSTVSFQKHLNMLSH